MTNKEYADGDKRFRKACARFAEANGIQQLEKVLTKRQASKFRRGQGRVYQFTKEH